MTALTEENRNLPLGGGDAIRCMHKATLTAQSKVSANCASRSLDTIGWSDHPANDGNGISNLLTGELVVGEPQNVVDVFDSLRCEVWR